MAVEFANWKESGSGVVEVAERRPWKIIILKR